MQNIISRLLCMTISMLMLTSCSTIKENLYNNGGIYGIDSKDRKSEVDERGKFVDTAGNEFNAYLDGESFVILYNSNNLESKIYADSVIKRLNNDYDALIEKFELNRSIPKVQMLLYPDFDKYKSALLADMSLDIDQYPAGPSPAFTLKANLVYLTCKPKTGKFNLDSPVHEFIHCLTMLIANEKEMPNWVFEGVAMYYSQKEDYYKDSYKKILNKPPNNLHKASETGRQGYMFGYSMIKYIACTYGEDEIYDLIKSYGQLYEALEVNEKDFINGWIKFLKSETNISMLNNF